MKVLDRPAASPTSPRAAIDRDIVRSKLKLDRAQGRLALDHIRPDPDQPRRVDTTSASFRDLLASVREHGVLEPITVRYVQSGDFFQIIAGERRYRAARAAGLSEIRAIVHDVDDTTKAIHQLVENLQREDFHPIEEASAMRRYLAATGATQDQLAARIGKSKSYVSETLAIDQRLSQAEKDRLVRVRPAELPGRSLIYAALRAPDSETRRRILFGGVTRAEARSALRKAKPHGGRPRATSRVFEVPDVGATVTVRFPHKVHVAAQDIRNALDAARRQVSGRSP